MYLKNNGLTPLYILLIQWFYILMWSSNSMCRTLLGSPCHDNNRFDTNTREKKNDIWGNSKTFLTGVHDDLKHTANLSSETLAQMERNFENEAHINHLKGLPNIPTLTWESFQSNSVVTEMLRKMYKALSTLAIFSNDLQESLESVMTQERQDLISMVREVDQGRRNRGGLYKMLCDIYRQIRHSAPLIKPSDVPLDFPDDVSLTRDEDRVYYIFQNMKRVLNGIGLELKTILDSDRTLRLYHF